MIVIQMKMPMRSKCFLAEETPTFLLVVHSFIVFDGNSIASDKPRISFEHPAPDVALQIICLRPLDAAPFALRLAVAGIAAYIKIG